MRYIGKIIQKIKVSESVSKDMLSNFLFLGNLIKFRVKNWLDDKSFFLGSFRQKQYAQEDKYLKFPYT